jgi:hypothetical protein
LQTVTNGFDFGVFAELLTDLPAQQGLRSCVQLKGADLWFAVRIIANKEKAEIK